jgi:hypothetical protein
MRFLRSPGPLSVFHPHGKAVRAGTGYAGGKTIAPFYRRMIAEVITPDAMRDIAIGSIQKHTGGNRHVSRQQRENRSCVSLAGAVCAASSPKCRAALGASLNTSDKN